MSVDATFLVPGPKIEFEATSKEYKGRGPPQHGCDREREVGPNEKEWLLKEALPTPTLEKETTHTRKGGAQ